MTVGQRIAMKRKELGLSQEALGEQMGVSRQAIYKWESDAALPEIEKLVALSRLFQVSVGWILGAEEEDPAREEASDELTPAQLKMVTEIVDRYIAAQPQPKPARKWPKAVAVLVLAAAFIWVLHGIDRMDGQYNSLQNAISHITYSVNSQIGGIANRVEEVLKAQNHLTAEFGVEVIGEDYAGCQVTLAMEAVPKTYTEGMDAVFLVDWGEGPREFAAGLGEGLKFSCQATVPLTDSITSSVVFIRPDGTRQTQVLDSFSWLLSSSYAEIYICDFDLTFAPVVNGSMNFGGKYVTVRPQVSAESGAAIVKYQVGLFRNKKLVDWAQPCEKPANFIGDYEGEEFFRLPDVKLEDLTGEDRLCVAVLVTDSYGRQYMWNEFDYTVGTNSDGSTELTYADASGLDSDPANWSFEP